MRTDERRDWVIAALLFATVGSIFFPGANKPRAGGATVQQKESATVTSAPRGWVHIQQLPDEPRRQTKANVRNLRKKNR